MPKRYDFTKMKRTYNGKRTLKTTLYPNIPKRSDDLYIYAQDGDRLDLLADKYYGNPHDWWIIARANNIGKGTLYVEGGTQLRIPRNVSAIYRDLEKINKSV